MLETLGLCILVKASTKLLPIVKENEDSTGCPKKNARSWHFGYNSTLEMARNKGRVSFEKLWKFSI